MTKEQVNNFLSKVKYKPEFKAKVAEVFGNSPGEYYAAMSASLKDGIAVHLTYRVEDAVRRDGSTAYINSTCFLSNFDLEAMTEKSFELWIYGILKSAEEHELGEWLVIDGRQPFDPHTRDRERLNAHFMESLANQTILFTEEEKKLTLSPAISQVNITKETQYEKVYWKREPIPYPEISL